MLTQTEVSQLQELVIDYRDELYARIPVRTHVIVREDDIVEVAVRYVKDVVQPGDVVFISEKAVAITQGRAIPVKEIKARPLAKLLSRFVLKTPAGIGLGMPETMEMALRECGTGRILFAAFVSAGGKLMKRRGDFYKVAGYQASSIDGPTPNTLPPYNQYVVLGPKDPDTVAKKISAAIGCAVLVADINDLGGVILGASDGHLDKEMYVKILRDNPLGQGHQQTPIGIIRKRCKSGCAECSA